MNAQDEEQVIDIKICEECPNRPAHAFFYTNKGRRATNPVSSKQDAIETMNSNPQLFYKSKEKLIKKINELNLSEHEEGDFGRAVATVLNQSLLLYVLGQILNPSPHSASTPDETKVKNHTLTINKCETPTFIVPPHGYIITEGGDKYRPGQFFSTQGGALLINLLLKIGIITEQEKQSLINELKNLGLPDKAEKGELDRIKKLVTRNNKETIQKDLRKKAEQTLTSTMTTTYFTSRS